MKNIELLILEEIEELLKYNRDFEDYNIFDSVMSEADDIIFDLERKFKRTQFYIFDSLDVSSNKRRRISQPNVSNNIYIGFIFTRPSLNEYNETVVLEYNPYEQTFNIYDEPEFYIPAPGEKKVKNLGWKMHLGKDIGKMSIKDAIYFVLKSFKAK